MYVFPIPSNPQGEYHGVNAKLAEALLRRKELQEKVDQIRKVRDKDCFDVVIDRVNVNEGTDKVTAQVPKLTLAEVTAEYDFYARQLRLIDGIIQNTNWTTTVDCGDCMKDYEPPKLKEAAA